MKRQSLKWSNLVLGLALGFGIVAFATDSQAGEDKNKKQGKNTVATATAKKLSKDIIAENESQDLINAPVLAQGSDPEIKELRAKQEAEIAKTAKPVRIKKSTDILISNK